ncbi:MAG: hypothetical protein H7Z38_04975 [Rubrivivax sp.]|nr:hypothetical protein [Pyrinomonadaceae bacterium]
MTLFAGIFSRSLDHRVPDSACEALRRLISRNAGDEVRTFKDRRSCFVKVDIGAYGEDAMLEDAGGSVSMLTGEPLLALGEGEFWQSRTRDLELLHDDWKRGDWSRLDKARGVFCGVHYRADAGTICLIADKLGVRPLYYWVGERFVAFATALRVLEGLAEVPKQLDVRAVTEMVTLGAPLADRTPYTNVALLKAAEIVEISETDVLRRQYWRWDAVPVSPHPESELLRNAYEQFSLAVGRRIREDKAAVAYLSGGLDSRCVVAALRERNVHAHTFNFAIPGTQDQVFGAEFARQIGALHEESPVESGNPDWSQIMADAWGASKGRAERPAERPNLAWSGDGGSVGLGHVHMTEALVGLLRDGKTDEAVEAFLLREAEDLPRKILREDVSGALAQSLRDGIREELSDIRNDDPGRGFYVFLMLNDQRRHLARHFEDIDLHRMEFQLPLMDSDFLASVAAVPVELCLNHKFYAKWLKLFPQAVTSVPWQTYPGHEACPLPLPAGLIYQWERAHPNARRESRRRSLLKEASAMLSASDFPDGIFRKRNFRLALWAYKLGVRDYGYLVEAARTYQKYWTVCDGNFSLPSV